MTQDNETPTDPAQAFTELRAEVSLMRRAVEGLTAARERMPDYTLTLGVMTEQHQAMLSALQRIENSPAVRLTPQALTVEIAKAGAAARAEDARRLDEAREVLARSVGRIDGIVERGQVAHQQARGLIWGCVLSAVAGMLLWSVLPGAIARSLPESWRVPEWMAARMMRLNQQDAEERHQVFSGNATASSDE